MDLYVIEAKCMTYKINRQIFAGFFFVKKSFLPIDCLPTL
jgi:hypothetical protein